jgi:hypothetical protein
MFDDVVVVVIMAARGGRLVLAAGNVTRDTATRV